MELLLTEDLCAADAEAVVTAWLCDDGDRVEEGTPIAEIMVEKAQFEYCAPAAGVLRIRAAVEQPIRVGDLIAVIE